MGVVSGVGMPRVTSPFEVRRRQRVHARALRLRRRRAANKVARASRKANRGEGELCLILVATIFLAGLMMLGGVHL